MRPGYQGIIVMDRLHSGAFMTFRWPRELPQLLLLLTMFLVSMIVWADAPESLPVHWNFMGEVDRYGGKAEALLLVPIIGLVMYVVLLLAPRLAHATELQLGGRCTATRWATLILLAVFHGLLLVQTRGVQIDIARIVPALVGILFVALGSSMGQVPPNAIMGVRTPWTLSSRAAWDASQRLGGQIFIVTGAMLILGGLLALVWITLVAVAVLLIGVIGLIWYGYRICQSDPHRLPRGQTLLS